MVGPAKRALARWLRIPPDPRPPAGSEASLRVFRASPRYLRYTLMGWGLRQLGVVIGLVLALTFGQMGLGLVGLDRTNITTLAERLPGFLVGLGDLTGILEITEGSDDEPARVLLSLPTALALAEGFGIAFFLLQAPLTLLMVLLDYDLRFYIVTDKSLRIREGVSSIREMTMTFANVQNLAIEQGPVQRAFGIADLRVRSAGGGSGGESGPGSQEGSQKTSTHLAWFRGIDDAHALRASILARMGRDAGAGLGDPDPRTPPAPGAATAAELAAAHRLLDEARALRTALETSR